MTVLKDKMLVRFEFSEDGQSVTNETEFFNYEWGRLRDICVSDDGKIYLATNGNTWPSQPPNEIIELSNADYYEGLIYGCTNATATNYNSLANTDDESCEYSSVDCSNIEFIDIPLFLPQGWSLFGYTCLESQNVNDSNILSLSTNIESFSKSNSKNGSLITNSYRNFYYMY